MPSEAASGSLKVALSTAPVRSDVEIEAAINEAPFEIVKKTAKRVYYIRSHDPEGRARHQVRKPNGTSRTTAKPIARVKAGERMAARFSFRRPGLSTETTAAFRRAASKWDVRPRDRNGLSRLAS
jgi:hypothetical protein